LNDAERAVVGEHPEVRVHQSEAVSRVADQLNARAFAQGRSIYLRPEDGPHTAKGREVLAHETAHAVSHADGQVRRVELTYDDGPDTAGETARILESLNAAGARATFYVVGRRVVEGDNYQTVFNIAASGHWLGNHAYEWNMEGDNHVFLDGSARRRAEMILWTEWAIRDALQRGKAEAQTANTWNSIPSQNRDYIDDVIANGTGRFRTPGFRSKPWSPDGTTTLTAIAYANRVLAAYGMCPLEITEDGTLGVGRHRGSRGLAVWSHVR
jgi:hypothetical protein